MALHINNSAGRRRRRGFAALLLATLLFATSATTAPPAAADGYDPEMAGHPLRIIAYVLHPVGVVIDYLLMRPAHWLISQEPIQTLVGHKD